VYPPSSPSTPTHATVTLTPSLQTRTLFSQTDQPSGKNKSLLPETCTPFGNSPTTTVLPETNDPSQMPLVPQIRLPL
jgi:hypothetical protein